ncbi:hypothetical protein HCU64_06380 [Methylobacterium sp. C25]|uniref:hypothetical protein n=1 Tax=Methylobacterium sp. C25 TaxID=2721622 RepID=UPI001F17BB6C|nr:hypothetical protein [Methylobacterium sp. C25]MCE4223372.1 hypothetical protein [Methylobacterium sp. C25]
MAETSEVASDWLADDLREVASDFAAITSAAVADRMYQRLNAFDAAKLRDKLAQRYLEWTGRDLRADLDAALPSPPDPA